MTKSWLEHGDKSTLLCLIAYWLKAALLVVLYGLKGGLISEIFSESNFQITSLSTQRDNAKGRDLATFLEFLNKVNKKPEIKLPLAEAVKVA